MAISKRAAGQMSNKELLQCFRNVVMLGMAEANTKRGLTKATEKSEAIVTEEMCLRLGFDYDPNDWKY